MKHFSMAPDLYVAYPNYKENKKPFRKSMFVSKKCIHPPQQVVMRV